MSSGSIQAGHAGMSAFTARTTPAGPASRHASDQKGTAMTTSSRRPRGVLDDQVRELARQTVASLLAGSGLQVRVAMNELLVTNPRDRDKGQVHIGIADGFVTW